MEVVSFAVCVQERRAARSHLQHRHQGCNASLSIILSENKAPMPITYEFDPGSRTLHAYHSGRQTVAGICDYFKEVANDPAIRGGCIEVVHFADDVEFDFTSHTARIIPIYFAELKNKKNIQATIFIGATQLQYGIARMMKNLHALYNPADDIRVVRTPEEAQGEINTILLAQDSATRLACS